MKINYNGALGPVVLVQGLTFTSGEPTDVTNEDTAVALLAKPYFTTDPVPPVRVPTIKEA
jgi:hypothetical protein